MTGSVVTCQFNSFTNNEAKQGGSVYLSNTNALVSSILIKENMACDGGAIYSEIKHVTLESVQLIANSAKTNVQGLRLISKLITTRVNISDYNDCNTNSSGRGGAIFVDDEVCDCERNSCKLIWSNIDSASIINNTAMIGTVLYGGMMTRCSKINATHLVLLNTSKWNYPGYSAISSNAIQLCFYSGINTDCRLRLINKTVYFGQGFQIFLACLDQVMQSKKCIVTSDYEVFTEIKMGIGEHSRIIENPAHFTFHAYSEKETTGILTITSDIFCEKRWSNLQIKLSIESCPFGFEKMTDRCTCDHRLQVFRSLTCSIDENSISLEERGWFGYDEDYLRIHSNCPLNYCSLKKIVAMGSHPHVQCDNNRGGIICSSCVFNYSLVLGGWKCKSCSGLSRYNFIWMTLILALAGVVLVAFLILLNITVSSGTLNGLILYANIISVSG